MAHTTIYDLGTNLMFQGQAAGTAAIVYRYNDGVTGVVADGWRVFIDGDGVMVRRIDPTERLCMKTVVPDDPDMTDVVGEAVKVTVGQSKNEWPSSALSFILGDRTMSWEQDETETEA